MEQEISIESSESEFVTELYVGMYVTTVSMHFSHDCFYM